MNTEVGDIHLLLGLLGSVIRGMLVKEWAGEVGSG